MEELTPVTTLQGQKSQHHPSRKGEMRQDVSSDFSVYHATPGPAIPKDFDVKQEGTKEERRAKAAEWNK